MGLKIYGTSVGGASVLDDKLEFLCDDIAAMHMVNLARLNGQMHVFVIHPVSEPEVIHMLGDVDGEQEEMGEQQEMGDVDGEQKEMGDVHGELEVEAVMEEEVRGLEEVGGVLEEMGDVDGQVEVEEVGGDGEDEEVNEVQADVEIRSWNSSFDNGSGDGNNLEGNVEVEVEKVNIDDCSGPCSTVSSENLFDVNVEGGNDRGLSEDEWESEELISGGDSDKEDTDVEGYGSFATFVLPKNMVDFKWEVGTYFAEKQDILDATKSYVLDNGRNIKFVKNDKQRMRLKCVGAKGKCPWRLYFGYMKAVKTWQLRTMLDNHTCSREFNLKLIDF
ncbi:hypothetical protein V8G54_008785 [Vigna mungo]|uniref:Transposase MuDR plant domain-containing protein n=1 Tax=Vigna mungo TaxID=3915 RepID=A0AAQ3P4S5_VIGMU